MGITVDADFPGGNIIVEAVQNEVVHLRQDLRTNTEWWFYWSFRVRHTAGQTIHFIFTGGDVFGARGPCFSSDGMDWHWLGRDILDGTSFFYTFPKTGEQAYFAFGIPYSEAHLSRFLADRNEIESSILTMSEGGRPVEKLTLRSLRGIYKVLITARHHACEAIANYVLEGILAFMSDGSAETDFLREQVDVHIIPFMDKDGVEMGDQGKMRPPHDHWEDYTDTPIYGSTRALMDQVASWRGQFALVVDLHCPAMRGGSNDEIFIVEPEPEWMGELDRFYAILEETAHGPLVFDRQNSIPYGVDWNVAGPNCADYFRHLHHVLAFTLEFPYALAGGTTVTVGNARQFGEALARAIGRYVQEEA